MPPTAAAATAVAAPVCDLGELIAGTVVKRPSATLKTPYVADVKLDSGNGDGGAGPVVLAHTPALDCAGLIVPGGKVRMTARAGGAAAAAAANGGRAVTTHAVQLAEEPRENGQTALVGAHPALAEKCAEAALERRLIPELGAYRRVLRQQAFDGGRVDFVLEAPDGAVTLVEVKNVVCADYPAGEPLPAGRAKQGVYVAQTTLAGGYTRTAIFPHGGKKKPIGVVSDRAIKHAHELGLVARAGSIALPPRMAAALGAEEGEVRAARAAVVFVVNRGDCAAFRPCHEACMVLARVLRRAQADGVALLAYAIDWQGGRAFWGARLPVVFAPEVAEAPVDDEHLQRVLHFNATDPRTHYKKDQRAREQQRKQQAAAAGGKKWAAAAAKKQAARRGGGGSSDAGTSSDADGGDSGSGSDYEPAAGGAAAAPAAKAPSSRPRRKASSAAAAAASAMAEAEAEAEAGSEPESPLPRAKRVRGAARARAAKA